jgi:hypothetical protein
MKTEREIADDHNERYIRKIVRDEIDKYLRETSSERPKILPLRKED